MVANVFTCSKGTIEYREPSAFEGLELGKIFMKYKKTDNQDGEIDLMIEALKHVEKYITKVDIKVGETTYNSYSALTSSFRNLDVLNLFAVDFMNGLDLNDKKKAE